MSLAIEEREEVMFYDTDIGGVVHNIAYLRMIEKARTRLATQLGMPLGEMASSGRYPVVVRTEIDYRKPATLGDTIIVHGQLASVDRARFWCEFTLTRQSDSSLLVTSRQALALVQMPEGRPLRLPEDWQSRWPHLWKAIGRG